MNAKHWSLRYCALILLLPLILLFTGCPGGDGGTDNPSTDISVTRTLMVEGGRYPVWVGTDSFLFNYSTDNGTVGIFWSDLDGNVTEVYPGVHNHDYVVSPSGNWAAFSTPDLDGGVYAVELTTPPGDPILLLAGGKRPDFLSDTQVLLENASGDFGLVDVTNPAGFTVYGSGAFPVANGDGSKVAYLASPQSSGFDLHYLNLSTMNDEAISTGIGTDIVWNPTEDIVYVSQLANNTLTQVLEIDISTGETTILVPGGTRPSLSRDGIHFYCDILNGEVNNGIQYINLESGREGTIRGAQMPAAAMYGTSLLTEQSNSIYLMEFE